jgi:hypothetical protein
MNEATGGLRAAFSVALVTALVSGGLLYQTDVRAKNPPTFSRGGAFSNQHQLQSQNLSVPTPTATPVSSGSTVSSAVLSAPADQQHTIQATDNYPPLGHYVYKVTGTESAQPFGSRDYPPEMTMTVNRPSSAQLKPDEFVFDLVFSDQHNEREIVEYTKTGVAFTYEAGNITFGPGFSQSDEANYTPPMLQVPLPLKAGNVVTGKSTATAPDGSTSRVEDWSVGVERQENLKVLGRTFKTWVVQIHRQSEPGGNEDVNRTRTYWYSPEGNIWLKWTEDFTGSKKFGPGTFTYKTNFTATLDRVEPL